MLHCTNVHMFYVIVYFNFWKNYCNILKFYETNGKEKLLDTYLVYMLKYIYFIYETTLNILMNVIKMYYMTEKFNIF